MSGQPDFINHVPHNCLTCKYAFRDFEVGWVGCVLLMEMPGAPTLSQQEYLELDLWDDKAGDPCPQWKEDDMEKEIFV